MAATPPTKMEIKMIVDTETKYRPMSLADYVYPNKDIKEVIEAYATGDITRPLILCGSNGTGKSLLASMLPTAIEGIEAEVNYVRAEDLNSTKEVRKLFAVNKQYTKLFRPKNQRYNYHIIEEVNFDAKATDAFKVVLDEYRGTDLTIITTNSVHKIDAGIRDRCEVVDVPACLPHVFLERAMHIIEAEGFTVDEEIVLRALETAYEIKPSNRSYYKKIEEILRMAAV